MGSLMEDFKRQASFFLREKIKTARLVLTDVTPAQILTEDVTNRDSLAADVHAMRVIARAAFEVDDYERIVHILHHRLSKFEAWNWRASYKALILLEHLLTHGPQRIAEEFEIHQDTILDMATFHFIDNKGFNWGMSVKNKSERVVSLLQDRSYLKEERARARKLTVGKIKGFGSFSQTPADESSDDNIDRRPIFRSKSLFLGSHRDAAAKANLLGSDEYTKLLKTNMIAENDNVKGCSLAMEQDHPFWDKELQTRASLLSSV
ncbi:ENTH domain-containing protein C794.11c-like [Salvia hispanica]|uniref:ENTH domain-containing protein C794.11c-like n=1 Tax=Salvia hispanica TaxID=49212 RepID=UPI002009006B|nr:ENTH domain-containing protein C794.11c-like [Salvia hispanica]